MLGACSLLAVPVPTRRAFGGQVDRQAPARADDAVAHLRRASGDVRLPPGRLTPVRLQAYIAAVRAIGRAQRAVVGEDPGAVLDRARQPALRPWEGGGSDPVRVVADAIRARPALLAAIRPHLAAAEFAAVHVRLSVCARAFELLGGAAGPPNGEQIRVWVSAHRPRPGPEADFAASLIAAADAQELINAAYADPGPG